VHQTELPNFSLKKPPAIYTPLKLVEWGRIRKGMELLSSFQPRLDFLPLFLLSLPSETTGENISQTIPVLMFGLFVVLH
jgi:hypothetical protein